MISRLGLHTSLGAVFPPEQLRTALENVGPELVVVETDDIRGCDGLVTFDYDDEFLSANLEWIHSIQAGVDHFPLDGLRDHGVRLTNSTGIHGDTVGETVAGYMLSFARGLHHYRSNQERGEWSHQPWNVPYSARGTSVCIVGLGTLGRGVAMRADALGMDVSGVKRTPTPVDHVETVYPASDLHHAIADAKFVVVAVPLNEDTERLIGQDELAAMREDAVLINVARGPVVDEDALIHALETGRLGGAALDVFEKEPLPRDSPLWEMDDVIVTPHVAAATSAYYRRIATLVEENLRRFEQETALTNRVV